jgi:UDP-N-acetylmuramyl pentapeptide phosphotransferase/UDP-N-acetylglucosamine-1-phosphate transferase
LEAPVYFIGHTLLGAILCLAWIRIITHTKSFKILQDIPNDRSSHVNIIPRGAGLAFPFMLLLGLWLNGQDFIHTKALVWALTALCISILGFVDDAVSVRAGVRLAFQFVMIMPYLYLVTSAMSFHPLVQTALMLVFALVILSSINFFNFADGINGYVALQFCLFLASWFWYEDESNKLSFLAFTAPLIGGLAMFLWENMKRKSVFMGDSGSTCLGFLVATIPLQMTGSRMTEFKDVGSLLAVVAAFGFVVFIDIVSALAAKAIYHIPLAQPHREHFYQRLSRKENWGHSRTSLLLLGIQLVVSLLFLLSLKRDGWSARWALLSLGLFSGTYATIVLTTNFKAIRAYSRLARS